MTRILSLVVSLVVLASTASAQSNIRNARISRGPVRTWPARSTRLSNVGGTRLDIGWACPPRIRSGTRAATTRVARERPAAAVFLDEGRFQRHVRRRPGPLRAAPFNSKAANQAVVLYRVENREVQRIRTYSESCEIRLWWLDALRWAE